MSLVGHNTEAFMSQVGIEFMINFMLNYRHSSGSAVGVGESGNTVAGKIQTQLKKLLHVQKTRDAVVPIGSQPRAGQDPHQTPRKDGERAMKYRSIFYSFLLRCVTQLLKDEPIAEPAEAESSAVLDKERVQQEKLLRFLHTT